MRWLCTVLGDEKFYVLVYIQPMKRAKGARFCGDIAKGFPGLSTVLTAGKELDQKQSKNENRPEIFWGVVEFHCCEFIQSWRIVATFESCEG